MKKNITTLTKEEFRKVLQDSSHLCQLLNKDEKIISALCYDNTIYILIEQEIIFQYPIINLSKQWDIAIEMVKKACN